MEVNKNLIVVLLVFSIVLGLLNLLFPKGVPGLSSKANSLPANCYYEDGPPLPDLPDGTIRVSTILVCAGNDLPFNYNPEQFQIEQEPPQ